VLAASCERRAGGDRPTGISRLSVSWSNLDQSPLAVRCQQAIAFPYYDPDAPQDLHTTLARIAAGPRAPRRN
jgi:hypothetical protein